MQSTKSSIVTAILFASLTPMHAHAHGLHGGDGFTAGLAHPLVGVDHLLAMIAVGFWAAYVGGRTLWAAPAAFITTMIAGGLVTLTGVAIPALEPLLAASVLALGLLLMLRARVGVSYGASLAAAFAVFHGAAHMIEMPVTANVFVYGAGFMLSTLLLQASGILMALAARGRSVVFRLAAAITALAGAWMLITRVT
jgi:urease accessory protein